MKQWTRLKSWLTSIVIVSNLLIGNMILAEECDDIAEILRKSELHSTAASKLSDHKLEQLALLSKDVESKRQKYARSLGLYLEKIGADKDVDQNRIDYEKAQIKLGDFWHRTKETLSILKKQEHLAQDWKKKSEADSKPVCAQPLPLGKNPVACPESPIAKDIKNTLKQEQ